MEDARRRVTVILDPDVADALDHQAKAERGTKSGVCRRVLSQWAAGREQERAAA
jgi:predicted transcriptional regulator